MVANRKNIESISIFFPAYNDCFTIGHLISTSIECVKKYTNDYEIIIINDGSTDGTKEILEKIRNEFSCVKVIHHAKNKGYGGAIKNGIANSTKQFIFYTDGDGQYDPTEMGALISKVDDNTDLVNGFKKKRADPFNRMILGKIYAWIIKIAFNIKLKDITCDFRLIRRNIFDIVNLEANSGAICVELVKKIQMNKFNTVEVPVHHFPRKYGKSEFFKIRRVFNLVLDLIILWFKLVIINKLKGKTHDSVRVDISG